MSPSVGDMITLRLVVGIALVIIGALFTALLSFAVAYLREIRNTFRSELAEQDRKIENLERRVDDMPQTYVFRDDYIRWTIGIDKKIEALSKKVGEEIGALTACFDLKLGEIIKLITPPNKKEGAREE